MFLSKADLISNINPEISALITRNSDVVIDAHLIAAVSTIRTYLAPRYDIGPELAKTKPATGPDPRYSMLLNAAKDIAIYLLYSNQETIPQIRVKRYDEAMSLLKSLAKGEGVLDGVPPRIITPQTPAVGGIAYGSNPRRPSLN